MSGRLRAALRAPIQWLGDSSTRTAVAVIACVLPIGLWAVIELPLREHLALSLVLMATGLVVARHFPRYRLVVGLLSAATSARYIWWRGTETLVLQPNLDGVSSVLLFGAECFGFLILCAGYFQTAFTKARVPPPLPDDPALLPTVDVYVPSYNEDLDIVRRTLIGAVAMDYPKKKVYLLDEKRRPEMKALCEELGVVWMTRPDNRGAKAGNINHALTRTDGDLVAVFDADQVPVRSFLRMTVGFFVQNPKVALVQTPHHFYNPDPFERNLYLEDTIPSEQVMFYHVIQVGNDFWNSSFFCGSCAVLRREALLDVGGIAQETVTEDAHTALRMHARGWESAYVPVPQAAGLATERYAYFVSQRMRWARGMIQILRLDNPLLKKGLTWSQRLNYFNAACHFLFGIPRMLYLLAPPAYLVFGVHPLEASAVAIACYALPHVFLSIVGGSAISHTSRHSFWAEVYETAIAPYIALVTIITFLFPRRGKFNVTAKGTQLDRLAFDWRHAAPNLVIGALLVAGMVMVPVRAVMFPLDRGTVLLAGFWNLYNALILFAAVMVALDRSQRRRVYRVRRSDRVTLREPETGSAWDGRMVDLSEDGLRVRLPLHDGELPARVCVDVECAFGEPLTVDVEVLDRRPRDGSDVVRCRFVGLTPALERRVVEQMFAGANTWIHQAAPPDRPLASALEVVRAPWNALLRAAAARREVTP
ncbi:MAG: UDP-forming cellulose synthase catalytic subunit [Myxococcota bacterium]